MTDKRYVPRLSVELTEELSNALNEVIPWSLKKYLFQALAEALIEAVHESGDHVLAAILRRQVRIKLIPIKETNDGT